MTTTTHTDTIRDDLFTHIHKGLRLALFDLTVMVGRTDWADPDQVAALGATWRPLLELLRAHTAHEDEHIFRLLDAHDPMAVEPGGDQHRDLDDLLDDLALRFDAVLAAPDRSAGLDLYRDVARFVAVYLPHLHHEETRVMARIWDFCTDEEIAACRARFMAHTTPAVMATTLQYLLPAIDQPSRLLLAAGIAGAPEPVVAGVVAIAERVISPSDAAAIRGVLLPSV